MTQHRSSPTGRSLTIEPALLEANGHRRKHRQRAQACGEAQTVQTARKGSCLAGQRVAGWRIAAMTRGIDQRPNASRRLDIVIGPVEDLRGERRRGEYAGKRSKAQDPSAQREVVRHRHGQQQAAVGPFFDLL